MKWGEGRVRISALRDIRFGTVDAEFGTASGWQQMPVTTSLSNSWGGGLDFRYRPTAAAGERGPAFSVKGRHARRTLTISLRFRLNNWLA